MIKPEITLFWFRRDLRLNDNRALFEALSENSNVVALYIFDNEINHYNNRNIAFIYNELSQIYDFLKSIDASIIVKKANTFDAFNELLINFDVKAVYTNREYEPSTIKRDAEINTFLNSNNIVFKTFKDHLIFEKNEVLKPDGSPYTIFTPYSKRWKSLLTSKELRFYEIIHLFSSFYKGLGEKFPSIDELGYKRENITYSSKEIKEDIIRNYHLTRDFPAIEGTSHLSLHLRYGTVSIRQLITTAKELNDKWLNELIWREFYAMILYHFPQVSENAFKKKYEQISWLNNEEDFEKWCNGNTGYPFVDAGLRELNATGCMHNRLRMVTASFLTKHLLINWQWGEAYFAEKLLDYDLASNNGGWQWASGSGCDTMPYFRIFNPIIQAKKFDKNNLYILKYIPEINTPQYSKPIIDNTFARERCINAYKKALFY